MSTSSDNKAKINRNLLLDLTAAFHIERSQAAFIEPLFSYPAALISFHCLLPFVKNCCI